MALAPDRPVADTPARSWVERAPARVRPYLRLARYDRPIGIWLLAGPSWLGMALANIDGVWRPVDLLYAALLGVGSIAMRGAGCTFNDIVDKDLDKQVARTASRPLPAGTVTLKAAWAFLFAQCLAGLAVLVALPPLAQIVALASIPVVAAYPFMKRITWFPQAWLGIALNWGVLVGFAAAAGALRLELWLVLAALAAWTFGYDTIYACQDKEDDALVGVKSTARYFGARAQAAVEIAYLVSLALLLIGLLVAARGAGAPSATGAALLTTAVFALHLDRQARRVRLDDSLSCLKWFRSNRDAILIAVAALVLTPLALHPLDRLL
jgi:4-hydroxybenzoate polyprenyltransferase